MEQVKPTEAPEVTEVANAENPKPALTLEILITRMMQTQRNIKAYRKGEMTEAEFEALGIKFF
jgi:hypothetical protein